MAEDAKPPRSNTLNRYELEAVIRRAVELSQQDADPSDLIGEDELIRIGGELGIEPHHIRQALLERPPAKPEEQGFVRQLFGPYSVVATRTVPCPQPLAHRRLEDYLVTREYLQIRRRQGEHAFFEPAEDAFSGIARTFTRPSSRFHLARAEKAYLTIRTVDDRSCHVRLELSFPEKRRREVRGAVILSGLMGVIGMVTGGLLGGALLSPLGDLATTLGATAGAGTGGALGVTGILAYCRSEYRKLLGRTQDEADALLDRLEHGDTLEPPAAPWLRRLQQKLRGFTPG